MMDKYQRHSIAIMIDSIEQQLKGLRALLALGANMEQGKVHDTGPKTIRWSAARPLAITTRAPITAPIHRTTSSI